MKSQDISWDIDATVVDATVTTPDQQGVYPGVVFVAGSGPTDRNWESPLLPGSNGSARLLAEYLTSHGYVTIRYDKRASGPRAMQNVALLAGRISLESHFEELQGAVGALLSRPEVDGARVFVLTSSEGALHAFYYQTHAGVVPFRGLVLTGAPGRAMNDIANYQVVSQLSGLPNGQELVSRYRKLIERFESGLPFVPDAGLPEGVNALVGNLSAPVNQPFSREFWSFRPADYMQKIRQPMLVVIGKKDIQTDWKLDGGALEKAARRRPDVTFFYPENANHVLKRDPTPRAELTAANAVQNYNGPDAVLDPETCQTIVHWLGTH